MIGSLALMWTDFDTWLIRVKLRMLIVGGILLVLSGCHTFHEIRYAAAGALTPAEVTGFEAVSGRGESRHVDSLKVSYEEADGTAREAHIEGPFKVGNELQVGDALLVQYIRGAPEDTRLYSQRALWPMIPFIVAATITALASYRFMRDYYEHQRLEKTRS